MMLPIVLGFDPVFQDIVVIPMDNENNRLTSFNKDQDHYPNSKIDFIPGGNSLNVAKIIQKFSNNVVFIGNFPNEFEELIKTHAPKLHCYALENRNPNYTVGIQFKEIENQFNSFSSGFKKQDLTIEAMIYLSMSSIVPFSNIGLNKDGKELFETIYEFINRLNQISIKMLNSNDPLFEDSHILQILRNLEIIKRKNNQNFDSYIKKYFKPAIQHIDEKIGYFDPSTLENFTDFLWLDSFLTEKFALLPGYKIISINKFEFNILKQNQVNLSTYLKYNNNFLIVHTSKYVDIYNDSLASKRTISVPKIKKENFKTTIGAGDAFNAGLLFEFARSFDIQNSIENGIKVSQEFICGLI